MCEDHHGRCTVGSAISAKGRSGATSSKPPRAAPPPKLKPVVTMPVEAVAALLRKHVRACNDKLLELLDVVLVHEGACPELDRLLCFLQHQDETGACPANAAAHSSRVLQSVFDHC